MFSLDDIITKNDNKIWPYRILIIGPSGSGKTNYLINKIQTDNNIIGQIYLYATDLEEPKYQLLIKRRENAGIKNLQNKNAFIEYSDSMDDIYDDINDYNKKRKRKVLIIFDVMISRIISDKKAQQVLNELFIRCRKLNISLCFLTQSYFSVPKDVTLNCTHYKRELQNIAINHSADIDYKDFVKICINSTREPYNFLTIDTKLPINDRFKKNFHDSPL